MRCFVTGCAGFVGSNLTDRLLEAGHEVIGFDNLSTGLAAFLENAVLNARFRFVHDDLVTSSSLAEAMTGADIVFHMAANADVRFGPQHPTKDLYQNTVATVNVLEAMRVAGVQRIVFASTGSVYGEPPIFPTPENAPFPVQTSLYGASKLSAECFIEAYCEAFGLQAFVFRFVSLLGERYTHGHVVDFCMQLLQNPRHLRVFGNGQQRKSYLDVSDCLRAMLLALDVAKARVNIFNLGTDEYCKVDDSIRWICEEMQVHPKIEYSGGERGWIGDNPFIFLDCGAIRALGWRPTLTIQEGVKKTVRYLLANRHYLHPENRYLRDTGQ